MSLPYNTGVPATNDNPSDDQPEMLINTQSINSIWDVDHYVFADATAGQHAQVTFAGENIPGTSPTDPASILYTQAGQANANAQLFFENQTSNVPVNLIKAYGTFNVSINVPGSSFTLTTIQSININTGSLTISYSSGVATLTIPVLTTGNSGITGNNVGIIETISNRNLITGWNFTNPSATIRISGYNFASNQTDTLTILFLQL